MSEHAISDAARRYRAGDPLATIGETHGVNAATVRRELVRADIKIRPRGGFEHRSCEDAPSNSLEQRAGDLLASLDMPA